MRGGKRRTHLKRVSTTKVHEIHKHLNLNSLGGSNLQTRKNEHWKLYNYKLLKLNISTGGEVQCNDIS